MTDEADFERKVLGWVTEVIELRHGTAGDPKGVLRGAPQETIPEMTDLLLRVRTRADRVDELLIKITLARGQARRAKEEAVFVAENAKMNATQQRGARRAEFSTGDQLRADVGLDIFEERRLAYQRDRILSITNDAYEVISQVHWQLDAIRKDLRAALHGQQFESSLER